MREPLLTIAVGKKGIGKTYVTTELIKNYVKGNPKTGFYGRKVLILDVNDEFTNVKTISLKHVPLFTTSPKAEARRVRPIKDNGKQMNVSELQTALGYILEYFYGGLLLIEDINRYVSDSIKNDLMGTLATQRHHNLDIIIHFQTKSKAGNPKLIGMCNVMRVHKTNDFFEKHKEKYADHIQILKLAEKLVYKKNKTRPKNEQWFFCYVNFDTGLITGDFTAKDFEEAVEDFVYENEKEVLKPILARRNGNGGKLYEYSEALKIVKEELYNEYYGG